MGHNLFAGNRYKHLVVSEGVESIGLYSFSSNVLLESVTLPSTLKTIDNYAFQGCSELKEIELPEGVESIGAGAFSGVPMDSVDIPDSVTYIGSNAFNGSAFDENWNSYTVGPTQVNIGSGLNSTGWSAFRSDAEIKVVLNSQRNMLVAFNDLENIPTICWDGKTDILSNDGSVIPKGETVRVSKNVTIKGKLKVEGTLIIPEGYYVVVKGGIIDNQGTIEGEERIVDELPTPEKPDKTELAEKIEYAEGLNESKYTQNPGQF